MTASAKSKRHDPERLGSWKQKLLDMDRQEAETNLRKVYGAAASLVAGIPEDATSQQTVLAKTRHIYALKIIAKRTGRSVQALIREAMERYVSECMAEPKSARRVAKRAKTKTTEPTEQQVAG